MHRVGQEMLFCHEFIFHALYQGVLAFAFAKFTPKVVEQFDLWIRVVFVLALH